MQSDIKKLTDEIVYNAKQLYGDKLKEVVLYGSYARGIEGEESDIDIAILVDTNANEMKSYEKN